MLRTEVIFPGYVSMDSAFSLVTICRLRSSLETSVTSNCV